MEELNSGIYAIVNTINYHVYIGQASNFKKRKNQHYYDLRHNKHHSPYLQNVFNKYGEENFEFIILEYVEPVNESLTEKEQYYIDIYDSANNLYGYNISPTAGSVLGINHTEEAKKKISLARIGKPSPNKGKHAGDETRKKQSKAKLGKYSGINSPYSINVINLTDKTIWNSITEAASAYSINRSQIIGVCKNKNNYKTAGGFRWAYYNPNKSICDYQIEEKRKTNKSVINITTKEIFNSIIEAAKSLHIKSGTNIGNVCMGKKDKAYGYKWMYYEDYLKIGEVI